MYFDVLTCTENSHTLPSLEKVIFCPMPEEKLSKAKNNPAFKTCGLCKRQWPSWEEFIRDPGIRPIGMQAITSVPDANLFLFEHRCGSTVSIRAKQLRHLVPDPEQGAELPLLFGKELCSGHCRHVEDLEACSQPCVNARDRNLLLFLLDMKRNSG
jgi:hypothetical protein